MPLPFDKLPFSLATNRRLDRWVRINTDGTVDVLTGKVEIGQGIVTAMAQMAADELDVALERVRMHAVDTTKSPDEGVTSGSRSVEEGGTAMRYACAEVRDLFLQAAARKLGATLESLSVDDGMITVRGRAETTSYWQLAPEVDLTHDALGDVLPKSASALKVVGRNVKRIDIPDKLFGAAYVHDLELPGMLHARVVRPPSYRARLTALEDAAARTVPGVAAVIREGSFLGVIADREEQAIKAAQALARGARWSEQADLPDVDNLAAFLTTEPTDEDVLSSKSAPTSSAVRTLSATYTRPYLAHASIGPSCALARWGDGDKLEVWSHCQGPYPLRDEIAKILGIDKAGIVVHHMEGAGCYGHNGADDVAFDAVLIARAVRGRPVRVQWSREDEFGWEPFGPAMVVKMQAALDAKGNIVDWLQDHYTNKHVCRPGRHPNPGLLAAWHLDKGHQPPPTIDLPLAMGGASQRNAVPGYEFTNERVVNHTLKAMPVRISTLRALGAYINVFSIESFLDELAESADADPIEYRLRYLKDPRARAVVESVAKIAGWERNAKGDGQRGMGIGYARYKGFGNYVAVIAEVVVDREVRVPRVWTALDCGRIVNPDGIINQAEGGIVQATSWTLKEQVRFDRTRITTRTWEEYPILTFAEAPRVETTLADHPDEPSVGVGEGMAGPTVAAIGNALANALGVRVRDLPFTPERVVAAMGGKGMSAQPTWIEQFPGNMLWSNACLMTKTMAPYGGAVSLAEIDEVCQRLVNRQNEPDAWREEWCAMGARLEKVAERAAAEGRQHTAGNYYLRAGMYYFTGERFIPPGGLKREVGRKALELTQAGLLRRYPNMEKVEVPFEGKSLPALFLKAPGASGRVPTVVVFDGMDNCKEMSVLFNGLEFAHRGWNTLAIDGPGQGESLRLREMYARHDYEGAGTAAYEYVAKRADVDPAKVVVMGYSFGGYYAARVAAFEERYCAGVAFAALHWDLAAWQREIKRRHEQEPTNTAQSNFHFRWIMGCEAMDEAIERAEKFSLVDVAPKISMPFLIVHSDQDRTVPVASAYKLYDAIGSARKHLKIFTPEDGTCYHVQADNRQVAVDYIADWIADQVERAPDK